MKKANRLTGVIWRIGSVLALGASISACAGNFGIGGDRWKEEVLLQDGRKIIVERSQSYGGRSEPGQTGPIREHSISFEQPISGKAITWTSDYDASLGRTNFNLLAVHVLNDTPYIVASPNLCLSYNKWGRPNPPYVFFKYEGNDWRRIPLEAFPTEFTTINVALDIRGLQVERLVKLGFVSSEKIKELNRHTEIPEFKTIWRTPILGAGRGCGEMVSNGKGSWLGIGWFKKQPSFDACVGYCRREDFDEKHCPCSTLFEER